MSIAFASFLERVSPSRVKLRVVMWRDTFELYVDKNYTQKINFKYYSMEEWENIDFESLNDCKQYYPDLEKGLTEATAKKIGINIPKTDVMIEKINTLIDSFVDDSSTAEHLKDEIKNILNGGKVDEQTPKEEA